MNISIDIATIVSAGTPTGRSANERAFLEKRAAANAPRAANAAATAVAFTSPRNYDGEEGVACAGGEDEVLESTSANIAIPTTDRYFVDIFISKPRPSASALSQRTGMLG
ncbi:MAG: hypothetical protein V1875_02575 [Candidatus Altiarchaeota archaeon]